MSFQETPCLPAKPCWMCELSVTLRWGHCWGLLLSLTCGDGALDLTAVIRTKTGRSGIVQSFPCAVEDKVNRK